MSFERPMEYKPFFAILILKINLKNIMKKNKKKRLNTKNCDKIVAYE